LTRQSLHRWLLAVAIIITALAYWPGLSGSFLFDDYPNIVDNHGVQPAYANVATLANAALSSPSSEFRRPLASLSFAANYLATGLDPYWMKLTNLIIHLLNGLLVFLLARALLCAAIGGAHPERESLTSKFDEKPSLSERVPTSEAPLETPNRVPIVAALIAGGWMLLPINLTGVLYVVQRMESMANLFVLLGLIGYVAGRCRMLSLTSGAAVFLRLPRETTSNRFSHDFLGLILCAVSITIPTAAGILAKETAAMLPLYALLIEWILFTFQRTRDETLIDEFVPPPRRRDRRIMVLFLIVLVLPMAVGLAWLLPSLFKPETWATRDFSMYTRLLSEARIVVDYIVWTLLPTPQGLSFYHDNFSISSGLLKPWTTLASMLTLIALVALVVGLRRRQPMVALGVALFLGCQLLTGTIMPLELIYEHRNYFASFGLLLAIVPLLAVPRAQPFALPRHALLVGLMLCWIALTTLTAYAWGNPLRLAEDLASRAPFSPRAQYELGRTYIIYSKYDPASPLVRLAYAPLEKSAALPDASIMPEQALIFMNSRMHLPLKEMWWDSLVTKLKAHKPGVQDESALGALTQCEREHHCDLPEARMTEAYLAALSHPNPSARLLAMYGDYAWNVLNDHLLGQRMTADAVKTSPNEPAYRITLVRMLVAQGRTSEAREALLQLQRLNFGGRLVQSLRELRALPGMQ
jgi:hypothetical protein